MNIDRKVLYTVSALYPGVLLLVCFVSDVLVGNVLLAAVSVVFAALVFGVVRKRSILRIERREVAGLMLVIALVALMLYFLSGLHFGFYRVILLRVFWPRYILPYTVTILASEVLRRVLLAQKNPIVTTLSYFSFVLLDIVMLSGSNVLGSFSRFVDLIGMIVFPAVTANLLYHYLSARWGALPVVVYKIIMTVYSYIIPYKPQLSDAMLAFARVMLPLAVYLFIHALYERRKFVVSKKRIRLRAAATVLLFVVMLLCIMLVSCQFRFGLIVIATESMEGEVDKGDAIIYEKYDDQYIAPGQVIVFDKNNTTIIHRVVDIKRINGEVRYFTKGDANDGADTGYITSDQIIGVTVMKVKYIGFPTLWARDLFR